MKAKFINESYISGSVWRSTDQKWLKIFLDQDQIIYPLRLSSFISFSFDNDSGSMDSFGGSEVIIEFDEEMIMQQDAVIVYYEPEWMETNPKETVYVTGYESKEDYMEQNEDAGENDWEYNLSTYEHEEEILMKKLKFEEGLIKHVYIKDKPDDILIAMLEENNIPYNINQ